MLCGDIANQLELRSPVKFVATELLNSTIFSVIIIVQGTCIDLIMSFVLLNIEGI